MTKIKNRVEINNKWKWNIESMYSDESLWAVDLEAAISLGDEFTDFAGRLTESSSTLLSALEKKDKIWLLLEKAYVYARMKRDEDNTVELYQGMCDKANTAISKVSTCTSFFVPELLSEDFDIINRYLSENKNLDQYKFYLMDLLREKDHVLSEKEESLMAKLSQLFPGTNDIFTMLNNGDISFGTIKNDEGKEVELTHGNYIKFMESSNREVRANAFSNMYSAYKALINTIATTYNYNTKTDVVSASVRNYPSALLASLSSDNISESVYTNLIKIVNASLPTLHKYMGTRKRLLGLDKLKMYDIYVPLIDIPKTPYDFEQGIFVMEKALAPLGSDYLLNMKAGLDAGWIDVYENKGKTSGAYSFGSYNSHPFILLNYTDTLKDIFTLVHEMGHSMHSFYTRKEQPFIYGGHSIFTAEVASTVNENLLLNYLLKSTTDSDMKKYLLNLHIEEFRTTLFRQTMFAEFELLTHKTVEDGGVLTAEGMSDIYQDLNKKYFGEDVDLEDNIRYEWARIPHFYNAFYVYKYATGFSAATAIASKIINEGQVATDSYLEFLKTGEKDYPIELLKIAGVDMSTSTPIEEAMAVFKTLVDEFDKLV